MSAGRLLLILVLCLFSISIRPARAQTGSLSAEAYWETLEEVRLALEAAPDGEPFPELAGRLEGITSVVLPDGTHLPVDHRYLAALLRADPPETERVRSILDRVFDTVAERPPQPASAADLDSLTAILSEPGYAWPEAAGPNPLVELWQRFLNWGARVFARLFAGASFAPAFNALIAGAIAVLLVLILRFVYIHSIRSVIREAQAGPETEVPPGLTADRALAQARSLSEAGDLREAVRYLYLAALLALEAGGHIRLDRTHTNRELLADLSPRPELARRFRSVSETFDRVWYGFQAITRDDFTRYAEAVAELNG